MSRVSKWDCQGCRFIDLTDKVTPLYSTQCTQCYRPGEGGSPVVGKEMSTLHGTPTMYEDAGILFVFKETAL